MKVTDKEVKTIKMLADKNISKRAICEITGRSESTVKRALSGKYEKSKCNNGKENLRSLLEENLNILAKIEEMLKEKT